MKYSNYFKQYAQFWTLTGVINVIVQSMKAIQDGIKQSVVFMVNNKENKKIPLKFRLIKRRNCSGKLWNLNFMSKVKTVKVAMDTVIFRI